MIDNPKNGREKCTDQKIDDEIVQHNKEHPEFSSSKITQQLKRKNIQVSERTVRRRLNISGV